MYRPRHYNILTMVEHSFLLSALHDVILSDTIDKSAAHLRYENVGRFGDSIHDDTNKILYMIIIVRNKGSRDPSEYMHVVC